jgi:hypothetical protein
MSHYTPLPQTPTSKHTFDDEEDILHNISSNLDLALNGNTTYKVGNSALLDPEPFRRLSISTISSMGRPRSASPYPYEASLSSKPTTFLSRTKQALISFWQENQGLFYVTFSQLFGASMNVAARLLELEGDGMRPIQLLFVRQGLTSILCTVYMWWAHVPDFPLGVKGLRKLLVARACSGFFGIYGMYCKSSLLLLFISPLFHCGKRIKVKKETANA